MSTTLTQLLHRWSEGDREALGELVERAYSELYSRAQRAFRKESFRHTLHPTALVNETYLQLCDQVEPPVRREHFLALVALTMRRLLLRHAERRSVRSRHHVTLITEGLLGESPQIDLFELEDALGALGEISRDAARVVELRFYGGLTIEETAVALDLSVRTVNRKWAFAKAWLFGRLGSESRS